ncbi:dihydrolipoyl dehydrogenase [Pseudonocardia aurantiaca]|uniref:Dihydrolipoyl dehydrogenase n=1 Tax=Pseudonocardia aurantiaca TaxID=75290 RepID=A0ABW4FHX0_9PSEU
MVVGEIAEAVDLLVVGAGPAGYTAALHAARRGRDVTLVDRDGTDGVGGVCLRVGCIPSKALIELADLGARAAAAGLGLAAPDLGAFQARKRAIVAELTDGIRSMLGGADVRVLGGELRFTRPDQAVVRTPDGRAAFVEFRDVVLATGSRPTVLPGLVPDGQRVLDSTGALDLAELPAAVAVVGAGYIGVELGTALAKLGAAVTLVEAAGRVLPEIDAALVRPVARRLAQLGVAVLTGAAAGEHRDGLLHVRQGEQETAVKADVVIVAAGRVPNTDQLGLDRLGVTPGPDGRIPVAPDRTVRPHVAAIGDVSPGPALAHKGYAEAPVAVDALCGERVAFQPAAVPAVVFGDPEIATVGLTAAAARAEGLDPVVTTVPMAANGRALTLGAPHGTVQLVTEAGTGVVLGLHVAGPHASELVAAGTVAIEMGATALDLADTIHVHPTVSEQVQEAAKVAVRRAQAPRDSATRRIQ